MEEKGGETRIAERERVRNIKTLLHMVIHLNLRGRRFSWHTIFLFLLQSHQFKTYRSEL